MKIRLIVEKDPETGRYSCVFPELPGCASAGDTEEEAIANAREALELWFEPGEIPLPETARLVESHGLTGPRLTHCDSNESRARQTTSQ